MCENKKQPLQALTKAEQESVYKKLTIAVEKAIGKNDK
jgi:hypothetical protein